MPIRIVRLGSPRARGEGVRLGTVRRPPRGVKKERYAKDDWYDTWLPNLAPSAGLVAEGLAADDARAWKKFVKAYESEMAKPDNARVIETLVALSHATNFSVGCYCEDETRCHRSVLREILRRAGARLA